MTQDQFMGLLRQALPFFGGIAVGKGWLTPSEVANFSDLVLQIAGPIMLVGSSIWAFIANSKKSILQSAGQMPEVSKVVVNDPALAASVPSAKVNTQ